MVKRIGELLVERGLITPLQLDQALKAQLIFGGHLGTCLLEFEFIDEASFGQALAELHGLQYAGPGYLPAVPPEVLANFPWKLAEKYKAIPIAFEEQTLHVAVIDPKNLDRLSSLTGCKIVPCIAPEFRVYEALEAHYGIPRSARLVRLCEAISRGPRVRRVAEPELETPAKPSRDSAPGAGATTTQADLGVEYGYGKSWRDVADELFRFDEHADQDAPPVERRDAPKRDASGPRISVFEAMSRAQDKDELARIVLDRASADMARVLLLSVKAETATPWDWAGFDLPAKRARSLRFPVTGGSIFSLMLGDGVYRGPVPDLPQYRWIYEVLGLEPPREALLLPVYLHDRLVAILYGDGGPTGRVRGETESHVNLARRVGLALSMLVLKLKICAEA